MPRTLKSRLALLLLLGIFLVPIGMSSLRGLTHVLTCEEEVRTPFTFGIQEEGSPDIGSALVLEPEEVEAVESFCGGLSLELQAQPIDDERVALVLPITNNTAHPWRGTVNLQVENIVVPVDIRQIPPGETRSDSVTLRLDPGTHELTGSLLVGP